MTRAQYTIGRGISHEVHQKNKIIETPEKITIPVFDKTGVFCFNKYRLLEGDIKYRYDKGSQSRLYNTQNVNPNFKVLYITEGEFDAMVLQSLGCNAVSSTGGAGTFDPLWLEDYFSHSIRIVFDNDNAGIRAAVRLFKTLQNRSFDVSVVEMRPVSALNDVTDYWKYNKMDTFFKLPLITINASKPSTWYQQLSRSFGTDRNISYYVEFQKIAEEKEELESRKAKYAESKDFGDDLNRIKLETPIPHYIHSLSRKKFAECLWHNDNNPSMQYNPPEHQKHPNSLHCYSCGAHKSVIDVVMKIYELDFKEAVEKIKKDFRR